MNIRIVILLLAIALTVTNLWYVEGGRGNSESNKFPKKEIYALLGAISQQDWEFVLANSTTSFRDETNASLIIHKQLVENQELSNVVERFVDIDLDSLERNPSKTGNPSKTELISELTNAISDKDLFFVAGLNSLGTTSLDYSLRLPTRITKASFDDSTGSLEVFYEAKTESSVDFSDTLWFEKQDGDWKLTVGKEILE